MNLAKTSSQRNLTTLLLRGGLVVLFFWLIFTLDSFIINRTDVADSDFSVMWAGGHAVVNGYSPYNQTYIAAIYQEINHVRQPLVVFPYPIWTVSFFVPLGWFSVQNAAVVWAFLNQLFFLAAFLLTKAALRSKHTFSPKQANSWSYYLIIAGFVAFLLTPHFIHSLLNGQTSFLVTLLVAFFLFWITRLLSSHIQAKTSNKSFRNRNAHLWAGILLVGWLVKPAVVLMVLPLTLVWLAKRRLWQVLVTAGVTSLLLLLVSLYIYPNWIAAWSSSRTTAELGEIATSSNVWGIASELSHNLGYEGLALPLAGVVCLVLAVLNWRVLRQQTDPSLIVTTLGSLGLATTFYSHNYDQLLLFLPGLALLDFALQLPRFQRILVWANLATILLIVPWLLNIQALQSSVAGLYALSLNLFILLLLTLTKVSHPPVWATPEYANAY